MTAPTRAGAVAAAKVAGFTVVLAAVFGAAWAAGAQVGPVGSPAPHGATGSDHVDKAEVSATARANQAPLPGLAVAQDGFRLVLADTVLAPGLRPVAFTIEGPGGRPVRAFDVEHEKRLHLVVVRRDHAGFQHLHPVLDRSTGTWTAEAALTPGQWRVLADFTATGGPPLVLGSDLLVPGRHTVRTVAGETRRDAADGYTVGVEGDLEPGEHSTLALRVTQDGAPVTDLQPYLGAYGHLVALREGDLAYLHVHPAGRASADETEPGPDLEFGVEVPTAGRYHLYLDFRHDDVVRTAHLVLDSGPDTAAGGGHEEHHR